MLGINKFKKPSHSPHELIMEYNFPDDLHYFIDRLKEIVVPSKRKSNIFFTKSKKL